MESSKESFSQDQTTPKYNNRSLKNMIEHLLTDIYKIFNTVTQRQYIDR